MVHCEPGDRYAPAMAWFALLHGAWGVPEEWRAVAESLRALGHHAIAVDIPVHEPSCTLDRCAETVVRATAGVDGPVIVVGHSAGGHVASLIPSLRPVHHVVYLAAFVPEPGKAFLVRRDGEPLASACVGDFALAAPAFRALIRERGDGTCELDVHRLAAFLAGDRAADLLVPMLRTLLRPNALALFEQTFPLGALPATSSTYLLTASDPVLPPSSQRIFARRLGVDPIEIPGADHGVHMKRPRLVASWLDRIARGTA
jgi:pimeloyl-ACP methyl ester carboxylesterase